MSFLEKEEAKQSTFWDWVVGIGVIAAVVGFTVFYQYQKRSSLSRFQEADVLFKARNLKAAAKVYEDLKSAQYLTTADDSTIYARLDTVETIREQQAILIQKGKLMAAAGDSVIIPQIVNALAYPELLSLEDSVWLDSVKSKTDIAAKP
jgi:hypothetical protein